MSYQILPFSIYTVIAEEATHIGSNIAELTGSQCIYPEKLQKVLINTLLKDEKSFCFYLNKKCIHPTFTYPEGLIDSDSTIFVSEDFYNQYFSSRVSENSLLNLIYNIPKTKRITLKRLEGNFPKDDSLNDLLTIYLEQCLVVNKGQQFTVGELTFEIEDIFSLNPIPKKNVEERLEEMDLTIRFNENITESKAVYDECSNRVINYNWIHHFEKFIDNKISIGFVGQLEVEIDFVISELPVSTPAPEPALAPEPAPVHTHVPAPTHVPEPVPVLSKDELRRRRLEALTKKEE